MKFLAAMPAAVSLLALAAHFYRQGQWALAGGCGVMLILLVFRAVWARRLVQLSLCAGAISWLWTMVQITEIRAQFGGSTTRMMIILCSVSAFTLLSALIVPARAQRNRTSASG